MDKRKSMSPIEFSTFLDQLEKEYNHYIEKGTRSKAEIAEVSLQTARNTGEVLPFLDRRKAKQVVMDTFPDLPEDRADDAGEMLHLVIRNLTIEKDPNKQ